MSDRLHMIGIAGVTLGILALSLLVMATFARAPRPTPVQSASVDPYHAANLEAKMDRLIEVGETQLTAMAPTATATRKPAASPLATYQVRELCPVDGLQTDVEQGDSCLLPAMTSTPKPTRTPELPCALVTQSPYREIPCEWDGE